MNYEEMSNFEINKLVWEKTRVIKCMRKGFTVLYVNELFDPCGNPSDAWPIIIDNEISILFHDTLCEVSCDFEGPFGSFGTDEKFSHFIDCKKEDVLRTAMICFLRLKDSENE